MASESEPSAYLEVREISKLFDNVAALSDVSFRASKGEFISILGPSGCGKTTILRVIAGLEKQTRGQVFIEDRNVSGLSVSKRNVGIVFQSYALFPNLTAEQNIAYGLKNQRKNRKDIKKRVTDLIDLVGLSGEAEKYPAQLSGGQQQRVALARAMALSPDLLLLDEPLSALDAKVRVMLRSEIRDLQKRLGVTTIMVTHDQEEALTMADRILVMNQGEVVQYGTPSEIYDMPATPFVADFIGSMNLITSVEKKEKGQYAIGEHTFQVDEENDVNDLQSGEKVLMAIRPEDVFISLENSRETNEVLCSIQSMEYRGPVFRVQLNLSETNGKKAVLEAEVSSEKVRRMDLKPNMEIYLKIPAERIRVYSSNSTSFFS